MCQALYIHCFIFILTSSLGGGCYYHPHLTDKEPKNAKRTLYKGLHCFLPITKIVFGSTQDRHMGVTLLPPQQR